MGSPNFVYANFYAKDIDGKISKEYNNKNNIPALHELDNINP